MAPITTGILIIGDEILKGQVQDSNSRFICQKCYELGIAVKHIRVIPDDVSLIASTIREISQSYDVIISCGGIGSTHDDVTFEAAALAFEDELGLRNELAVFFREYFNISEEDSSHPALKMASIPSKAKLNYGSKMKFPVVSLENVYFFPGIPQLLEKSFTLISPHIFESSSTRFYSKMIYTSSNEVAIVHELNRLVQKHPEVTFGSYPRINYHYYKTRLSLESTNESFLEAAFQESQEVLPQVLTNFDPLPHEGNVYDKIMTFIQNENEDFKEAVTKSFQVIDECFTEFGNGKIFICFNGGKDCIVTLHLVAAYVWRNYGRKDKMNSIYIRERDPFPEVEEVISQMTGQYNLNLTTSSGKMKACLQDLLDHYPSCKAMILGTRSTDPYSSNLKHFSPTDKDWPSMMRVNPVLHWKYENIWKFIRGLYLSYPGLYDRGFTSLGSVDNTKPNPQLKIEGSENDYEPAYMLKDEACERDGRQ